MYTKCLLILCFIPSFLYAQTYNEKKIKKLIEAKEIVWDELNQDGIFKALDKKTKKWGMFQCVGEDMKPKRLLLSRFDSLGFFTFNTTNAIVKVGDKYGMIKGSYAGGKHRYIVKCKYDFLLESEDHSAVIMANINNKWGYINDKEETILPFIFDTFADLPAPSADFRRHPMTVLPPQLAKLYKSPESIEHIDLSACKLGYIPEIVGKCINAKTANFEGNELRSLSAAILGLKQLEELYLGGNPYLIDFSNGYISELTKLRVLYIGKHKGKGADSHIARNLWFNDKMKNLVALEELHIAGAMNSGDIPSFVYFLPKLKKLELNSWGYGHFSEVRFGDLMCKASLKYIKISDITDFTSFNKHAADYVKLKKLWIETHQPQQKPLGILKLPAVEFIYLRGGCKKGDYASGYRLKSSGGVVIPMEKRQEVIDEWVVGE